MTGQKFERLVEIMATLRGPAGCPWDTQQDFSALKPMLVEEVYEVLEAIENNDFDGLSEDFVHLLDQHRLQSVEVLLLDIEHVIRIDSPLVGIGCGLKARSQVWTSGENRVEVGDGLRAVSVGQRKRRRNRHSAEEADDVGHTPAVKCLPGEGAGPSESFG